MIGDFYFYLSSLMA